MRIGNREFDTAHHTYVMGILNITPDSFSDGGKYNNMARALAHAERMVREGASIIDVGGESTRPGYESVSDEEEMERILPVIEELKRELDVPISADTCKASVAREAIRAGADLINDIWGLRKNPDMAGVIAEGKVCCCLMHNRENSRYADFLSELESDLLMTLRIAEHAGIRQEKIILDPGVGFGKTYEQNLMVIASLRELSLLGYPLLLGTSRKSVIGLTLDLPVEERMEGTLATSVYAVMQHTSFVRVHDVKENVRAIRMAEAIRDCGNI